MRSAEHGAAERFAGRKGVALLWVGFLGGPAAWFFHLVVSYSLVRYVCFGGSIWLMHLVTGVSLLAGGAVAWLAWRNWRHTGSPLDSGGSGTRGRSRFLALLGVLFAAFSLFLIAVQGIPNFVLEPCV